MWSAIIPIVLAFIGLFLIGLFLWNRFLPPAGAPTATQGIDQFEHFFIKDVPSLTPGIIAILPSETPTPSVTPTPGPLMLVLVENANCRRGPGSVYPVLTSFLEGQSFQVDGRTADFPRWWWVLIPGSNQHCWVSDAAGTPAGDPAALPVIQKPPTPTPTPKPGGAGGGIDFDGDGYNANQDCNDKFATIHPGAPETPGDGVDSNCNGKDDS
jgi:hypothetical protein